MRPFLALCTAAFLCVGCGHLDLSPEGDPGRLVTGTIVTADEAGLPAGASVTVRIVDNTTLPGQVLGATTFEYAGTGPAAFHVVFRAEDDLLRRGLNIDVRVSIGGKVRYYTRSRHLLSLGNVGDPHRVFVEAAGP